jgi:hypothetical protein
MRCSRWRIVTWLQAVLRQTRFLALALLARPPHPPAAPQRRSAGALARGGEPPARRRGRMVEDLLRLRLMLLTWSSATCWSAPPLHSPTA